MNKETKKENAKIIKKCISILLLQLKYTSWKNLILFISKYTG